MKWGIDVSEHNQPLSWQSLKKQGASFVIVRLGWGKGHLDSRFYEQVNGVLAAGLELGIYYYSYALTEEEAAEEARFTAAVLKDCGLSKDRLPAGCWLDMEDADGYKEKRGIAGREEITALCHAYLEEMEKEGYPAGLYSSCSWLEEKSTSPPCQRTHPSGAPSGAAPAASPAPGSGSSPAPFPWTASWWMGILCGRTLDTPAA